MALSALHRKVLEQYKKFREEPPLTVWHMMRLALLNHTILLMLLGACAASSAAANMPYIAAFAIGVGVGCVIRDFGSYRLLVKMLPAFLAVIDWNKVDQVLAGEAEVPTSATR